MKAKRITRCLTVKKTVVGVIRADVCGAHNGTARGLHLCDSDMIKAINIHILLSLCSVGHRAGHLPRPVPTQDSVFSVSLC